MSTNTIRAGENTRSIISFVTQLIIDNRPHLHSATLVCITAFFILTTHNHAFWKQSFIVFDGFTPNFIMFIIAISCLATAYLFWISFTQLVKWFLIINVLLCASISYFQDYMGIIVDREMIQNILTTTFSESKHIITNSFIFHMLLTGIVPSLIIAWVKVKHQPILRVVGLHTLYAFIALAIAGGLVFSNYKTFSSVLRTDREMIKKFTPKAQIAESIRFAKMVSRVMDVEIKKIGLDAKYGPNIASATKPTLTILVIGETLRDQSFGLSGYERNTTPELSQRDVVNFSGVKSCGTSTAVSLPCMFSKFDRSDYSYEKGRSHENLLDILSRAGYDIEWWDVNTGSKEVANRVDFHSFYGADDPEFCNQGECTDGIFLQHIRKKAKELTKNTVLILHQIGNHGPAYYMRYPKSFEKFSPSCESSNFDNCTSEEVINAYDNAVAYTDKQLALTIDFLQSQKNLNTSLVYVSDHGESLGEHGLYLHGAPYWIAPDTQTTVPMVFWMSKGFRKELSVSYSCLEQAKDQSLSHDNFFHFILGMLDVQTNERNSQLDIFNRCKSTS